MVTYPNLLVQWKTYCEKLGVPTDEFFRFEELQWRNSNDWSVSPFGWVPKNMDPDPYPLKPRWGAIEPWERNGVRDTVRLLYRHKRSQEEQIAIWVSASLHDKQANHPDAWYPYGASDFSYRLSQSYQKMGGLLWETNTKYTLPITIRYPLEYVDEILQSIDIPPSETRFFKLLQEIKESVNTHSTRRKEQHILERSDFIRLALMEFATVVKNYRLFRFYNLDHSASLGSFENSEDLAQYIQSNPEACQIVDRYQSLRDDLPLSDAEKEELLKGAAKKVHETIDPDRKHYPVEFLKEIVYRMPRLNLGPVILRTGVSGIEDLQRISYDIEYFLGGNQNLKQELFTSLELQKKQKDF